MKLNEFIKSITQLDQAEEIVFYGGSFNPWHDGHNACVSLAPKHLPLIVMPDNNPQKSINKNKNLDFVKLHSQLLLLKEDVWIYDGLYLDNNPNPTIDWLKELHQYYPTKNLSLLLGHDSFVNLKTWKNATELIEIISCLYIVSRQDDEQQSKKAQNQYQKINPQIKISYQGHHHFEHLSSTRLR